MYTNGSLMLDSAGMAPAEGRVDASIIVRWTRDAALLSPTPPWPSRVEGIPLTDPVQQWRDLIDLGDEDRHEAAGRLRRAILGRTIPRSR